MQEQEEDEKFIFGKEIVTQEIKNKVLESLNSHR